jgi:hypothetical protein
LFSGALARRRGCLHDVRGRLAGLVDGATLEVSVAGGFSGTSSMRSRPAPPRGYDLPRGND